MREKIIGLSFAAIVAVALSACKTQYIPVPETHTQIEYRDRLQRDSIFFRDSVFVKEKGDTIYIERERVFFRDRHITDTFVNMQTDTLRQVVEIEKPLSGWQLFKMKLGGAACWLILLLICFGIGYFIKSLRK